MSGMFDLRSFEYNLLYQIPNRELNNAPNSKDNSKKYVGKGHYQQIFFPVYAKTSKMIQGNRSGRHSKLERTLKK